MNQVSKRHKSKIPKNPNFNVHSITFLDCVELEDYKKLENRLIKITSKYKGREFSIDPNIDISKAFKKFDSDYNTISFGHLYHNDTKGNEELDLIDGISYGYVKGAKSHLVMTYTITPSDKFHSLFRQSINEEITSESEINFKSIKQIIKTKQLISSIGNKYKNSEYWIEALFNEISFQFKTEVISNLNLGVFNLNNEILFPRITSFEYEPNEFKSYQNEIFDKLNISRPNLYSGSNVILSLTNVDYSRKTSFGLEIFIPNNTDVEKEPFNHISFLSKNYMQAIASYWILINLSCLRKQDIVELRKRTFKYFRKNKISLFLRKVISLKNNLTLNWISFENIRKDFTADTFKYILNKFEVPDSHNSPWDKEVKPYEFKESLVQLTEGTSSDIKKSYEEILELHSHIVEDNSLRASMRLQKILLIIALIGIILTLYGANSEWCNSWIEYFLNKLNIRIPRVKSH
ncbi:hypothetical protein [Ancylomarina sp. 16SWW S1-10-2]|uniref:hypothetical protein n=1 Tax=Ancylomarina sp. 16SWW S1-10-2 TaxID=2499681 RepID=UPI0012AEA5FB|nr:hypothetical protein [Ancylomarina sp. 16SWW S1-10-2]MRT94147.1 hypothetical protein [Ancylomarina sp. 16SWW S1-10-2]